MAVERVGVEEIMGEPKVVQMSPMEIPQKKQPTPEQIEAQYSAVLAAMQVAAKIIAVRFFLFLSLVGSFVLSMIATGNGSIQSAWVLIIYSLVTIFPLSILECLGKRNA